MSRTISRRRMLRGMGAGALGLPFLSAMLPAGRSVAQAREVPKRLVIVYRSNGVVPDRWFPTTSGGELRWGANMMPLQRHRADLAILERLDMVSAMEDPVGRNPHDLGTSHAAVARPLVMGPSGRYASAGHLKDGSAGGPSIDQLVARRLRGTTLFDSLVFGSRAGGLPHTPINHAFWRDRFEPVTPMQDPAEAFARIFAPLGDESASRAAEQARRQRLLDGVSDDLARLRGRLGAEDRRRLDAHASAVGELEDRLAHLGADLCQTPDTYAGGTGYQGVGRYLTDLMVHALACDLTRVAAFQWSTGESRIRFSGHADHHHGLSHGGDSNARVQEDLSEADRFYAGELAHLLDELAAVEEADGSRLLDHTAVVFINEVGKGNNHSKRRLPFLVAGMPSVFRTGGVVDARGAAHADLYVSVLRALGYDDRTFGIPEHCSGPLGALLR